MPDEAKTGEQLLDEVGALPEKTLDEIGLLRAVIEEVPVAIYVKDRQGRYLLANAEAARTVGRLVEEMLGQDDTAWFAPEAARRVMAADRRVMESGAAETYEHVGTATGVTRAYLTTKAPFRGPQGEILGVLGISRDVTERKRAEDELRRQKEALQTIFDHIPVMIRFLDPAGRYQLVNRHWEEVLGWSLEETRERDIWAEFYPDPQYRQQVLDCVRKGPPGWFDFKTRVREGRILDTSWAFVVLSDGTRIGIGQDVTERRQAEQALEQYAARLQVLSRRLVEVQEEERRHLALELHDEIGQVLTSLKFAVEASTSLAPEMAAAKLNEARALIEEALNRVRELSFDLRPALLDHFGLCPALRWLIDRYTFSTGVRVNFISAGLKERFAPELETAAYRVVQEALTNIARHARIGAAAVRVWVAEDTLQVQVEDEGAGFDPAGVLALGSSTGVPGMYERVRLLGGRLTIESAPGSGTHLLAELPLGDHPGRKIDEHFNRLGR